MRQIVSTRLCRNLKTTNSFLSNSDSTFCKLLKKTFLKLYHTMLYLKCIWWIGNAKKYLNAPDVLSLKRLPLKRPNASKINASVSYTNPTLSIPTHSTLSLQIQFYDYLELRRDLQRGSFLLQAWIHIVSLRFYKVVKSVLRNRFHQSNILRI